MNFIDQYGIDYTLDNNSFTAIANFSKYNGPENIEVPKSIKYNDQYYSIVCVKDLNSSSNAKSMTFPDDSLVTEIINISITSVKIPPLVEEIDKCFENSFDSHLLQSIEFHKNSKIKRFFMKYPNLNELIIPSSIQEIHSYRFKKGNLKSITFKPNSNLQIIGIHAFSGSSINEISIPSSVKEIKRYAFYSCQSLSSIEIPNNSELKIIEAAAFDDTAIKRIKITSRVEKIVVSYGNFRNIEIIDVDKCNEHFSSVDGMLIYHKEVLIFANRNNTSASIPSSIKKIIKESFSNTKYLKNIEFQEDSLLEVIENNAFEESGIEEIKFPFKLRIIENNAFQNCKNLKKVDFYANSELCLIGDYAFNNSGIESIDIPSNVIQIGDFSFENCQNLKAISLSNVLSIGKASFQLSSITEILIPSSVQQIGASAFSKCEKLSKVKFLNDSDLRYIEDNAFNSTELLETIEIPSKVYKIGKNAFENCSNLKKVVFLPNSELCIIDDCAFKSSAVDEITIPPHVERIGVSSFERTSLKKIEFIQNSELKIIDKKAFKYCSLTSITIPSHVQIIEDNAFECGSLKSINIDQNSQLRTIGSEAFKDTQITSLNIPSKVDDIREGCFIEMRDLKSIIISKDNNRYSNTNDGLLLYKENEKSPDFNVLIFANTDNAIIPPYVNKFAMKSIKKLYTLEISKGSKLSYINNEILNESSIHTIILPFNLIKVLSYYKKCNSIEKIGIIDDNDVTIDKLTFTIFSKDLTVSFINAKNVRIKKGCKKLKIIVTTKTSLVCEDNSIHEVSEAPKELLQTNRFPSKEKINEFYKMEYEKNQI